MIRKMRALARWLDTQLRRQMPQLARLRAGFHAAPSMPQLHLHLLSLDFASEALKNKKHYNSFATDFFVPPEVWERQLEAAGSLTIDKHTEEAKLKRDMRCVLTGAPLKNMPELKAHLASPQYKQRLAALPAEPPC